MMDMALSENGGVSQMTCFDGEHVMRNRQNDHFETHSLVFPEYHFDSLLKSPKLSINRHNFTKTDHLF